MNKSQIFHKDFFIFLFTNLFLINIIGFSVIAGLIGHGFLLLYEITPGKEVEGPAVMASSLLLGCFLAIIPHKMLLPLIYNFLEKKSKNVYIQQFIFNLRSNRSWKLYTLSISLFIPFILQENIDFVSFIIQQFFLSGCSSYVVLFLWWEVEKFIKRRNERIKYYNKI